MFTMDSKIKRMACAVLLTVLTVLTFAGCASDQGGTVVPARETQSVVVSAPVETPIANLSVDTAAYDDDETPANEDVDNTDIVETLEEPSMESVEAVAAIKDMEPYAYADDHIVYMDSSRNPYDVIWDYGYEYDKYVDAVDETGMWDVLFDADFYAESFPMLAMLYRYDADLLLEHFQTVGIHEGRQGSEAFNVESYMGHCDSSLVDAFGDNYECYYFYWALNQDTESDVDASGDGWSLQLCAEMTFIQWMELEMVNEYRAEVGADPVVFDSELAAFACYRATVDMLDGYDGHDWMDDHEAECNLFLDAVGSRKYTENTVHGSSPNGSVLSGGGWYLDYRNSESHYEAMVNPSQKYFGCSNMYVHRTDDGVTRSAQFDIYTTAASTPLNP